MVTNTTTYPINSMVLGKIPNSDDRQTLGIGGGQDPCLTLQCNHHHCVAIIYKEDNNVLESVGSADNAHIHNR